MVSVIFFIDLINSRAYGFVFKHSIPSPVRIFVTWRHNGQETLVLPLELKYIFSVIAWKIQANSTTVSFLIGDMVRVITAMHLAQKVWWQPRNFGVRSSRSYSLRHTLHVDSSNISSKFEAIFSRLHLSQQSRKEITCSSHVFDTYPDGKERLETQGLCADGWTWNYLKKRLWGFAVG